MTLERRSFRTVWAFDTFFQTFLSQPPPNSAFSASPAFQIVPIRAFFFTVSVFRFISDGVIGDDVYFA